MKDFMGKTAVVTGAASGIGRALSLEFAGRGANVVMADIEAGPLEAARDEVAGNGAQAIAVPTDVTTEEAVEALADAAYDAFGAVHVVCNNAGVLVRGSLLDADRKDWEWILSVNLWGVIHGVRAFVPRMLDGGEAGHVVNTASVAGHFAGDHYGVYNTSKFAVVGLTESLGRDLRQTPIGVSMLCPAQVETGIFTNTRRPEAFRKEAEDEAAPRRQSDDVLAPADVARMVLAGIENEDLYIFTHAEGRVLLEKRFARLMRGHEVQT